jgi:transposase-like protein
MNPHDVWCPNVACPARDQLGKGNIGVHSQKEQRYRCTVCGKTFGARTGTLFQRRRTDAARIIQVNTLVRWGCPISAYFTSQRSLMRQHAAAGPSADPGP